MHELRYRGELLGFHDDEDAARAHARAHHAEVEDQDSLSIEPARPVRLYCRGNLVDTFRTIEGAMAAIDKFAGEFSPPGVWSVEAPAELAAELPDAAPTEPPPPGE